MLYARSSSKNSLLPEQYGWIEVDGKPLQVYGAEETDKKSIGYIEAREGQNFVVRFSDQTTTPLDWDFCACVFVDGTK